MDVRRQTMPKNEQRVQTPPLVAKGRPHDNAAVLSLDTAQVRKTRRGFLDS